MQLIKGRWALTAAVLGLAFASVSAAAPESRTVVQDTFLYSSSNLANVPFGGAPFTGVSRDRDNARTVWSLYQFDVTGLSLSGGEQASFNVTSLPATGTPFNNVTVQPTPTTPATVDVYRVTQAWNENTVTWNTKPTVDETPVASFVVNDVNKVFSADLTTLLSQWLDGTYVNYGVELRQRDVIQVGQFDVAVVLGGKGSVPNAPATLVIPEPTALASLAGFAMLGRRRRGR
jgi:hypothetical protein